MPWNCHRIAATAACLKLSRWLFAVAISLSGFQVFTMKAPEERFASAEGPSLTRNQNVASAINVGGGHIGGRVNPYRTSFKTVSRTSFGAVLPVLSMCENCRSPSTLHGNVHQSGKKRRPECRYAAAHMHALALGAERGRANVTGACIAGAEHA